MVGKLLLGPKEICREAPYLTSKYREGAGAVIKREISKLLQAELAKARPIIEKWEREKIFNILREHGHEKAAGSLTWLDTLRQALKEAVS